MNSFMTFDKYRVFETEFAGRPLKVETGKMTQLANGAVDVLLVSEAIKKRRITVQCQSGHVHEMTVDDADGKFTCPECGANAQVINDEDYIDDFFNKAEMFNTRLQLISPDSEEGDMLLKAFGGVAALLRYKM